MFHKSATIDPTASLDFGAVVHSGSLVAGNVRVGSGTVVGPNVTIGQSTKIGYNVALANCTIGDSCVIHNGVCIGQDGDNVEIGANSCIDRGSWRDTTIGDHSKIDNLVQIGHNVVIGKCCILCGQVGIAGSVTMGDYVTLGGRVGVRDHVTIVSKVRLAAASCVTKDITKPGDYGGFPAVPIREWRRQDITEWEEDEDAYIRKNLPSELEWANLIQGEETMPELGPDDGSGRNVAGGGVLIWVLFQNLFICLLRILQSGKKMKMSI
nr:probable UDP-3-O-acylglucosamine N-acyltransferase 2, mitochondrial [Tanacetum cinerariifolium]